MNPASMDDPGQNLARWAASGDQAALERALAAAADPAYDQALRLLGRAADADDATQEALVQLTRSAHRYDPSRPFRPWLARLVHDACCRLLRSNRRRQRHEAEVMPPPGAEPPPMDPELVRAAVLGLPEPLRAVVDLHYFAGLSQAEAAQALGIGEGACAMRLSRARQRLRGLLAKQGLGAATTAAALAVLTAAPAHAAPAGLAVHIAGQAAVGTLPATTIPLTPLQFGAWFMATHPVSIVLSGAVLAVSLVVSFTLKAEEAPTVAPVGPATVVGHLSASASALLPYLDSKAPFRGLLDLETLRPLLLQAKPFSAFADERLAPAIAAGREQLERAVGERRDDQFWLKFFLDLATDGRAISCALRDRTGGERNDVKRMLMVADAGAKADDVATRFTAFAHLGDHKTPPPPIGPFAGLLIEDETIFAGRNGTNFVVAHAPWLSERVTAPAVASPSSVLWFHGEAAAILAHYALLSGPDQDPGAVSSILGPQWRSMRPVIEGTIDVRDNELVSEVHVSGAGPLSPATLLTLLASGTKKLPLGAMANLGCRPPRLSVPTSADRIAMIALGLKIADLSAVDMDWELASIAAMLKDGHDRLALLQMGLATVWSGDLAVEICAGAPMPRCILVMGLTPGCDPHVVLDFANQVLGGTTATEAAAGQIPGTATALTSVGPITVTVYADRLALTWNADIADWPGIATAAAAADAPACALQVDLPAIARTWYPLAAMALPPELRHRLPPLPALLPHLPVWSMTWDATADGCRIRERGLPLATLLAGIAAASIVLEADPVREVEAGRHHLQHQQPQQSPSPEDF